MFALLFGPTFRFEFLLGICFFLSSRWDNDLIVVCQLAEVWINSDGHLCLLLPIRKSKMKEIAIVV